MYVLIVNDAVAEYPYSIDKLRRDNPNVSFPVDLTTTVLRKFGVYTVTPADAPVAEDFEDVVEVNPAKDGVRWRQAFEVRARQDTTPPEAFERLRGRRLNAVKQLRDVKEEQTALTPFGLIDTNERSAKRLNALQSTAVAALVTGAPWQIISWTLADNTEVVVDSPQKGLQLTGAVMVSLNALHVRSKALKAEINAVTFDPKDPKASLAALRAIDINTGWDK